MERVYAYIDGFNLYHGIKAKGWDRYLWLDLHGLAGAFLLPGQELHLTKYCTSRISGPPSAVKRQATFIDALKASGGLEVIEGKFDHQPEVCNKCGHTWDDYEEKQTDVNIAVEMMADAYLDRYDVAFVLSGDADLQPAFSSVQALHKKRIVSLFPPARVSDELRHVANSSINVGRKKLADNLLPDEVTQKNGHVLRRPDKWK